MPREIYGPRAPLTGRVQPIISGGTGTDDLVNAPASLGLVDNTKKNVDNGVVGLDSTGKLPSSAFPLTLGINNVNIDGNFSVNINTTSTFQITDFDSFRAYTVSASAGTISLSGDTLTFVAPGAAQSVNIIVNGRTLTINVTQPNPATPSITAPVNGAMNVTNTGATIYGTAFVPGVDSSPHLSTDWQVATDSAFSSIVQQSISDTTNKVSWNVPVLSLNTTYYVRCRYRATTGVYSNYSPVSSFTTRVNDNLSVEETTLQGSSQAQGSRFGRSCAMSADGTRCAIGADGDPSFASPSGGAIYVFLRSGTTWTLEASFSATDVGGASFVGTDISMSSDGTRVVAGAPSHTIATVVTGAAYVFLRTGTTWAQEARLLASDRAASDQFGQAVAISGDGTRIVVGAYQRNSNAGGAYTYRRNTTTNVWTQEQILAPTVTETNNVFGCDVAMNNDGSRVLIGSSNSITVSTTQTGAVFVFLRTNTTWTQEAKIWPGDLKSGDGFGKSVGMSRDGNRFVASGNQVNTPALTNSGASYVYKRTDTTWTLEQKIYPTSPVANQNYSATARQTDINDDGSRITVGASGSTGTIQRVYVFSRTGNTWAQTNAFVGSDTVVNDSFGSTCALSGDGQRLMAGAILRQRVGNQQVGEAYIFR